MNHISRLSMCLLSSAFILATSCKQDLSNYPAPTDTVVKMDMEDGDKKTEREAYIEMIHGGKDFNWRAVEEQNTFDQLEIKRALRAINTDRVDEEWVAEGFVKGKWIERGSSNQAGNITTTAYDVDNDVIYCIGGGGPIFKGNRFGVPWTLVNDDIRFSHGLLEVIDNPEGDKRLISSIGTVPYYSDDEGVTWTKSVGVTASGGNLKDAIINSDQEIFFLHKFDYWSNYILYKSFDFGASYQKVKIFNTSDQRNLSLCKATNSDEIYVTEQLSETVSRFYKYNSQSQQLDDLISNSTIGFGENGIANIIAVTSDTLTLHVYNGDNQLHTSRDTGKTWTMISTLPTTPWDVSLFMPGSDPTKFMYGEVNSYRSRNQGQNWEKINDWWEYYQNVEFKLHADIMCYDEYYTAEGEPFVLIGNHGGISLTTDYGETNTNIGMLGLNVGQFYDVKSYPSNPNRFFGGTQDQGLQKGKVSGEGADDFIQMISGDYGHLQFTGPNQAHMWTVYPGGSISFYTDPLTQGGPNMGYEIDSKNETVWIPPIMPSADLTQDVVYAAGGSIDEESEGSYILRLEVVGNQIDATQLPFDFSISGGQIASMAISPFDKDIWWVATTNGYIYKSLDGGQSFDRQRRSLSESHYLYGSCILPSKLDPNIVYISGNGYNASSPVFKTEDGGESWQTMKTGMPRTTAFKIVANEDESLIFASTEAGPYVWVETESKWFSLVGEHTPNQTFWSVEFINEQNIARFSTYGRGIWDFEVTSQDITYAQEEDIIEVNLYPNPASELVVIAAENINEYNLRILNGNGIQVNTINVTSMTEDEITLDISDYPNGMYFVSLIHEECTLTKRLIKVAR